MLKDIKEELLKNPDAIVSLLETFGFAHINLRNKEIRLARDEDGGQNIRIRLKNNEYLSVTDYVRNIRKDIFSYIIEEKNTTFRDVLKTTKKILNLGDDWSPRRYMLFGGIYNNIRKESEIYVRTYPDNVIEQYVQNGNSRWLNDGISLNTQMKFNVGYDDESQRIVLPIRNQYGDIIGIKGRVNGEPQENEAKYLYLIPCLASSTLYGYCENYQNLVGEDVYIFESEKSIMQLDTMGYHNGVALMSNSLSETQAKLLLALNPKRIIFMLDNGLDLNVTKRNADILKSFCAMRELEIFYWDWTESIDTNDKDSATDFGKEIFDYILESEIKPIEEITIQN